MKRIRIISMAVLAFLPLHLLADATHTVVTGNLSKVTSIEIARLPQERLEKKAPAQDGVVFVFRIDRLPGSTGYFTLSELRDFTIDRHFYRKPDTVDMSTLIEPQTVIEDWADFIDIYRPDLRPQFENVDNTNTTVMIVEIYGPNLPDSGNGSVSIDVGWGKETELLAFTFQIENMNEALTRLNE